jgi:hypothetical protein
MYILLTLDSVKRSASEPRQGCDSGGRSLRVSLKDEAMGRVSGQLPVDLVDDILSTRSGILTEIGRVNGIIFLTSGSLGKDLRIHGPESCRRPLNLASSSGIDESVFRAGGSCDGAGVDGSQQGSSYDEELR